MSVRLVAAEYRFELVQDDGRKVLPLLTIPADSVLSVGGDIYLRDAAEWEIHSGARLFGVETDGTTAWNDGPWSLENVTFVLRSVLGRLIASRSATLEIGKMEFPIIDLDVQLRARIIAERSH